LKIWKFENDFCSFLIIRDAGKNPEKASQFCIMTQNGHSLIVLIYFEFENFHFCCVLNFLIYYFIFKFSNIQIKTPHF